MGLYFCVAVKRGYHYMYYNNVSSQLINTLCRVTSCIITLLAGLRIAEFVSVWVKGLIL